MNHLYMEPSTRHPAPRTQLIRVLLFIFTLIFALRVITIFTADRLYSMSLAAEKGRISPEKAITFLTIAAKLDSTNAKLYFKEYEILNLEAKAHKPAAEYNIRKRQLYLLKRCVRLCPSWPAYHLYYALILRRMVPWPNVQTRKTVLSELKKSTELKPYSRLYEKIYRKYQRRFSSKTSQSLLSSRANE